MNYAKVFSNFSINYLKQKQSVIFYKSNTAQLLTHNKVHYYALSKW